MRSTIQCALIKTNPFGIMVEEVRGLLDKPPSFKFFMFDIIEQENDESIVSYPDIECTEPLIGGETTLVINYINNNQLIQYPHKLKDPSWKTMLNAINEIMIESGISNAALQTIELVGLSEDGMGYTAEAVMLSQ